MGLGWLKTFISAPADVTKIVDGALSGLDKLKYTAEEKAEDQAKLLQMQANIRLKAQEQVVEWMKATAPQARTRRFLAKLTAILWAVSFTVPIIMNVMAVWMVTYADRLRESARTIAEAVDGVDQYMLLVMGFYLGAPHVSTIVDGIVARKQGRRKIGEPTNGEGD